MDSKNMTSGPSFQDTVNENNTFIREAERGLQKALLEHCLLTYLLDLVNKRKQIVYGYRGKDHCSQGKITDKC